MNWKKGFFRLWVAFTSVWLIFSSWLVYENHIKKASRTSERIEKIEQGAVSFEIIPPSKSYTAAEVFSNKFPSTCLRVNFDPAVSPSESKLLSNTHVYCDLPKNLTDKVTFKEGEVEYFLTDGLIGVGVADAAEFVINREISQRSGEYQAAFSSFLLLGILPPLILKLLGFVIAWVLWGFKARA